MFPKQANFKVLISPDRDNMGYLAAEHAATRVNALLSARDTINMVFAAAPSQLDFLKYFRAADIDFSRIRAFHMDEYARLSASNENCFANFLRKHLFERAPFMEVHTLSSEAEPESECARYEALLRAYPPDIIIMGIGENGHIAFNDPHEADFEDARWVKLVTLDNMCRQQQVNDGCFKSLSDVPERAVTLTVPVFRAARSLFCVVPTKLKAEAVKRTVYGEIGAHCPATVLRLCTDARLYLDEDSASLL